MKGEILCQIYLSGEIAEMDYSVLSPKEKQTYLNKLKEHCMDKVAHKMIMKKDSGRDFRKTMAKLQPEVCDMCVTNHDSNFILMMQTATLSHCIGCEYSDLQNCSNVQNFCSVHNIVLKCVGIALSVGGSMCSMDSWLQMYPWIT